jgi:phosphoenolpyruvate synthase/pyruvate phosphate dikinase
LSAVGGAAIPIAGGKVANLGELTCAGFPVPPGFVSELPDQALRRLTRLGAAIEQHFERPRDIEWAWAGGELFIVQVCPITVLPEPAPRPSKLQRRVAGVFAEMLQFWPCPLDLTVWMSALFTVIAWIRQCVRPQLLERKV